jgi:integrase
MPILTDKIVTAKVAKRTRLFDDECRGFYADITPTNVSFRLKVWSAGKGRQDNVLIGRFNPVTLDTPKARREAYRLKGEGGDIAAKVQNTAAAVRAAGKSFDQVADELVAYISELIPQHGQLSPRRRRWHDIVNWLKPARAAFGRKAISEVTARDILALLKTITDRGKRVQARRVRTTLHGLFRFAAEGGREYVTANPCSILPRQDPVEEKERVLDADEIRTLWWGLDRHDAPCDRRTALAFRLILATALRPTEVLTAQRKEIKEYDKLRGGDGQIAYRVPPQRAKRHRAIVQPLNSLAQEIVAELVALDGQDGLLFPPGPDGGLLTVSRLSQELVGHMSKGKRQTGILRFLGFTAPKGEPFAPFTSHDLRRTAATHLEINDVSLAHIAQVLDHQKKAPAGATRSTLVYARGAADARRATLAKLDGILRGIIGKPPTVVKLRVA